MAYKNKSFKYLNKSSTGSKRNMIQMKGVANRNSAIPVTDCYVCNNNAVRSEFVAVISKTALYFHKCTKIFLL